MDKSKNEINEEIIKNLHNTEIFLIVSIDKNEKIIQFNKECEKITGYTRYEVLNKNFFDFLIPKRYINLWRRMVNLARQNQEINNLKLPWLTKQKNEIMVPWNYLPIEKVESEIGNICLVGKLIIPNTNEKGSLFEHKKERIQDKEAIIEFIKAGIENKTNVVDKSNMIGYNKNEKIFNLGKNRVIFKNIVSTSTKKKSPLKIEEKKTIIKPEPVQTIKEKKIEESFKPPIASYRSLDRIIKELEKKNKKLEKENKILEKNLKTLKLRLSTEKKEKKSKISTLFKPVSEETKKEESESIIHELDERKNMLEDLEAQLIKEKESINKQKDEFFKWRRKLEELEDEIENRRKELVENERMFNDRIVSSSNLINNDKFIENNDRLTSSTKKDEVTDEFQKIFDEILESAAIVQRGILKQVNQPFLELLGYDAKDVLLDKSLLDFIDSEGLSGIEEYYLNRLKGVTVSSYDTIFLTSDSRKIHVEIFTKPIIYNGEKADIAIVKNMKYINQDKDINQ